MTCILNFFGFSTLILAMAAWGTPLAAQTAQNCGPRAVVIERLADHYGETRQSMGLGGNNTVIEVFASHDTGTWTITVTQANGVTCLVASGQGFETISDGRAEAGKKA